MKTRTTIRTLTLVLLVVLLVGLGSPALAVSYMPGVTAEMASADYWAARQVAPDELLMTREQIAQQNAANIAAKGTGMFDLKNQPETIDGVALNEAMRASAAADAKYYLGWTYGSDGSAATQEYFDAMIANGVDPNAQIVQPVRYGIAVKHTTQRVFASSNAIMDDPADPDFDYLYLNSVHVNEPVVILLTSADGAYYLTRSDRCSGWVPAEDIAVCKDKAEWLDAWDFGADEALVVYGAKVYTAASNYAPEVSRRMLTQGTVLQLAPEQDPTILVNNRAAYHNHIVYLPVRNADGSYLKHLALIAESAPVSAGYLPLTQRNVLSVALGVLGENYGWGGMLDATDCSLYVHDVYRCFGLQLARNTTWQIAMPVYHVSFEGMPVEQKAAVIAALPAGTTLFFKGHEMTYLGAADGKLYVVSNVSSIMHPTQDGKVQRTRSLMINTLNIKRANGRTWLGDLSDANVPYQPAGGFVDVPAAAYYVGAVDWALGKGVTSGTSGLTFSPHQGCSRAEAVTLLWRAAGSPEPTRTVSGFADVEPGSYYEKAVLWAVERGITSGTSETAFSPAEQCTRAQIVTFLNRAAGTPAAAAGTAFADVSDTDYFAAAVAWAAANGVTAGTTATTFSPDLTCTRAQIVTFLQRAEQL